MVSPNYKPSYDRDPGAVIGAVMISGMGIAIAGGLFPILLLVFSTISGTFPPDPSVYFGVVLYFFAGCVWAGFCSIISSIVTVLFDLSFDRVFSPRRAVVINGGMAGFIASFPTMFVFSFANGAIVFLMLTPLAMLMGYIGAVASIHLASPSHFHMPDIKRNKLKFQVRDLLVATFWFASVFGIERLIGDFVFTIWIGIGVVLLFVLVLVDNVWLRLCQRRSDKALNTNR